MKPRYFVVITVGPKMVAQIEAFYRESFGGKVMARNIHMSLLPPFFLKEGQIESEIIKKITEVEFSPFIAKLTGLDIFEQKGKRLLYAKVEPEDKCRKLSDVVNGVLKNMVEVDISPYTDAKIPAFKAHVTLDYNFTGTVTSVLPELSFMVERVAVFKGEDGEWVECGPFRV